MFHVVSGPSHQILESSSKIESYCLDIKLLWFEDRLVFSHCQNLEDTSWDIWKLLEKGSLKKKNCKQSSYQTKFHEGLNLKKT